MPEVMTRPVYRVDMIKSERGWGTRINKTRYFDSEEDAMEFVNDHNKQYTYQPVPDQYIYAEYVGKIA